MDSECWKRTPPIGHRDKALHNYLVWKQRLNPVSLVPDGEGPFITLGNCKSPQIDKYGKVIGNNGNIPAIVHQYTRHPELAKTIQEKYGAKRFALPI
jgi:hypothetical protein